MGSGNLHNTLPGPQSAPVPRSSSSDADKSLHASGVKGSTAARQHGFLAAGRAASLLAQRVARASNHGPLAQVVRAHG